MPEIAQVAGSGVHYQDSNSKRDSRKIVSTDVPPQQAPQRSLMSNMDVRTAHQLFTKRVRYKDLCLSFDLLQETPRLLRLNIELLPRVSAEDRFISTFADQDFGEMGDVALWHIEQRIAEIKGEHSVAEIKASYVSMLKRQLDQLGAIRERHRAFLVDMGESGSCLSVLGQRDLGLDIEDHRCFLVDALMEICRDDNGEAT